MTSQGWGPQTPDRLQSHFTQRHWDSKWGVGVPSSSGRGRSTLGPASAIHPPTSAAGSLPRSPAWLITPGRGGLAAKEEEGRNNLLLPPQGPALTLPRSPSQHRRRGPACWGYLCHRGKRPRKPGWGGCSRFGDGAGPFPWVVSHLPQGTAARHTRPCKGTQ